jgi:hypothetical protein
LKILARSADSTSTPELLELGLFFNRVGRTQITHGDPVVVDLAADTFKLYWTEQSLRPQHDRWRAAVSARIHRSGWRGGVNRRGRCWRRRRVGQCAHPAAGERFGGVCPGAGGVCAGRGELARRAERPGRRCRGAAGRSGGGG